MATDEEWTCRRKRQCSSRKRAIDVARRAQADYGRMRAYRCPFCSWYHVGHPPSTRRVSSVAMPSTPGR